VTKIALFLSLIGLTITASIVEADLNITETGDVGVGTAAPAQKLHVFDGNAKVSQTSTNAILEFAAGSHLWRITQNVTTGRLVFFYPGGSASTGSFKFAPEAQENLLRVGVKGSDVVDINGRLLINNTEVNVPDYVFEDGYELPSIEEQTKFMFEHKHLPSVSPAGEDRQARDIDVLSEQMGMLEELEKAHIYISQLNSKLDAKDTAIAKLEMRLSRLEALLRVVGENKHGVD